LTPHTISVSQTQAKCLTWFAFEKSGLFYFKAGLWYLCRYKLARGKTWAQRSFWGLLAHICHLVSLCACLFCTRTRGRTCRPTARGDCSHPLHLACTCTQDHLHLLVGALAAAAGDWNRWAPLQYVQTPDLLLI
jgi:hypothetical protein